jgi:DNA-binding transcriptional LysR family regulator
MLPDYIIRPEDDLVRVIPETDAPSFDTYFCYPDALKNQAKLQAFRDFLISKSRGWVY